MGCLPQITVCVCPWGKHSELLVVLKINGWFEPTGKHRGSISQHLLSIYFSKWQPFSIFPSCNCSKDTKPRAPHCRCCKPPNATGSEPPWPLIHTQLCSEWEFSMHLHLAWQQRTAGFICRIGLEMPSPPLWAVQKNIKGPHAEKGVQGHELNILCFLPHGNIFVHF